MSKIQKVAVESMGVIWPGTSIHLVVSVPDHSYLVRFAMGDVTAACFTVEQADKRKDSLMVKARNHSDQPARFVADAFLRVATREVSDKSWDERLTSMEGTKMVEEHIENLDQDNIDRVVQKGATPETVAECFAKEYREGKASPRAIAKAMADYAYTQCDAERWAVDKLDKEIREQMKKLDTLVEEHSRHLALSLLYERFHRLMTEYQPAIMKRDHNV